MALNPGKFFDFLRSKKKDFQLTFLSPSGQRVLQDLMPFCRCLETVYHPDEKKMWITVGRQEVMFRILNNLNLSIDQLYLLVSGATVQQKDENDC